MPTTLRCGSRNREAIPCCSSCGSSSGNCGCSNSAGNGMMNGGGPVIVQAPAPIIMQAAAPVQQAPQPIFVFADRGIQQQCQQQPQSQPTPNGVNGNGNNQQGAQGMPSTSTPSVGGAITPTPTQTQTPSGGSSQTVPQDTTAPTPLPTGTTNTQGLPATTTVPTSMPNNGQNQLTQPSAAADNSQQPQTPSQAAAQPIIINIHNSQDTDSRNRVMNAPEITDSYNNRGATKGAVVANAIPAHRAKLYRVVRPSSLGSAPPAVPESKPAQTQKQQNKINELYHYVGWS